MSDSLTVLRPSTGVLTKRLALTDGGWKVIAFSGGRYYSVREVLVGSFRELAGALAQLSPDPRSAVIRGKLLADTNRRRCRRLLHPCSTTGEAPTFAAVARHWLATDIDSLPEPAGLVFAAEPEAGVEHVLGLLPEPFADASCYWQCTGQAGVAPGIRLRLWFWLSRALDDAECRGWLARSPVDRSLYNAVTLHYTAAPILEPGTPDPVVRRFGIRQGLDDVVEVPDALPLAPLRRAVAVEINERDLSDDEVEALRTAMLLSPVAAEIWTGARTYPPSSTGHFTRDFAFGCALARGGVREADLMAAALVQLGERQGKSAGDLDLPGYLERTVGSILAAEPGR